MEKKFEWLPTLICEIQCRYTMIQRYAAIDRQSPSSLAWEILCFAERLLKASTTAAQTLFQHQVPCCDDCKSPTVIARWRRNSSERWHFRSLLSNSSLSWSRSKVHIVPYINPIKSAYRLVISSCTSHEKASGLSTEFRKSFLLFFNPKELIESTSFGLAFFVIREECEKRKSQKS